MCGLGKWWLQAPIATAVAAVTCAVISVSVTVSFCINALKGEITPISDWLLPSFLSPLVITPIVAYLFLSLVRRLENLREQLAASVERERLLAHEMRHRIKNLFSVTSGLISLAEREVPLEERDKVPDILRQKLASLSRASDATFSPEMPAEGSIGSFEIGAVVQSVLAPYEPRVYFSGEDVTMNAQSMTSMALLLHELATNSLKYGALGSLHGMVDVSWSAVAGNVVVQWRETGGPLIAARPERSGFGSALIDRFIRMIGGTVKYEWLKEGLVVEVALSRDR